MHFSCLVITETRPDEDAIEELLWPWCVSNDERRAAKVDYWEASGGPFANAFSVDDVPAETSYSDATIGPGNQLRKKDVPFERLSERDRAVLPHAVLKGDAWYESGNAPRTVRRAPGSTSSRTCSTRSIRTGG